MSYKVHLSAPANCYGSMRQAAQELNDVLPGADVISRWLTPEGSPFRDDLTAEQRGEQQLADILAADLVIVFTDGLGARPAAALGDHLIEYGIAFAAEKAIVIVGPRVEALQHVGKVPRWETWPQALEGFGKGLFGDIAPMKLRRLLATRQVPKEEELESRRWGGPVGDPANIVAVWDGRSIAYIDQEGNPLDLGWALMRLRGTDDIPARDSELLQHPWMAARPTAPSDEPAVVETP